MDSLDSEPIASEFYVPNKLYEDDQVTLYTDFTMDVREDQEVEPESRPTYMQEILSGKRRLLSMSRPRFPSLSATTLTPILTPVLTHILTPVQRISAHRKSTSTHRVVAHRRRKRQKLEAINEQLRSGMIAEVPTRYSVVLVCLLLTVYRLQTLETDFSELEKGESEWPLSELPDPKGLYTDFYEDIHKLTRNIVCGSCGCIGHNETQYHREPIASDILNPLKVDPGLVPFDFSSRYVVLKERQIMVDDMAISDDLHISLCSSCHHSLADDKKTPRDSLANYRWIGDIPEELRDLNWIEESLISAHLIGKIVRLQNRNVTSYFAIKGHAVLVPQDTRKLVDLLPASPDSLLDSIRVVWVSKTEPNKLLLRRHFTVHTEKVRKALDWLCQHHEDYQSVEINEAEIQQWPSVFVAQKLMDSMGRVRHSGSEDASRSGYGVEDMDITSIEGDLPISASALVDTNGVSDSPTVAKLQELARLKNAERVVNVVTGTNLLSDYEVDYYFTAAFPTIFPYGSGKHLDGRRRDQLSLSRWIQLLLRHSSRYVPTIIQGDSQVIYRRFQRHHAFIALAFDVTRRRHNASKASLQTQSDNWEATERVLTSLTSEQLLAAADQARKHQKITDPGVLTLLSHINRIGATSAGSDEKKITHVDRTEIVHRSLWLPNRLPHPQSWRSAFSFGIVLCRSRN